jgi:uncharacterized protein
MVKLLTPQEIEVYYIIPGIRSCLSRCMKEGGFNQSEIAELLQIDKATVSQYISGKRGGKVKFDVGFIEEVGKSAKLISDKQSLISEVQRLVLIARRSKVLCQVHKQVTGDMNCPPELERLCMGGK